MSSASLYKIIVSGVTFNLSEASLQSDSPGTNLLAMALLGDFAEANERTLVLDRNAVCFALIRDHLNGYSIFPLDSGACGGMEESRMLRYLRNDAEYYGLARLAEAIRKEMDSMESKMDSMESCRTKEADRQARFTLRQLDLEHTKVRLALHEARVNGHLRHIEATRAQYNQIKAWDLETHAWKQTAAEDEDDPEEQELLNELRHKHSDALQGSLDALGQLVYDVPQLH